MKKLAFNPYLPFWETVPDGEPRVFGDRLYIYGSHDELGGSDFCVQDYVCWSASIDDLGDWRYEGVIYRKDQDPFNGASYDGITLPPIKEPEGPTPHIMNAPDVTQGPDGRYYLYYELGGVNVIAVAVSDTPAGNYEFLNFVTRADGSVPDAGLWFDPAILVEESGNYLYYGFSPYIRAEELKQIAPGGYVLRLANDMHTIIEDPKLIVPGINLADGTDYESHPFFEASSIRHYGDYYYFVYSSAEVHELCYAMSHSPEGPFLYKGVLISNGDLGFHGNQLRTNYTGNNHGGMVCIKEQLYIFWHRQTHGTSFSRQGCADKLHMNADGTIDQTEITSCGLNHGPLPSAGTYSAHIACHITAKDRAAMWHVTYSDPGEPNPPLPKDMPYLTEEPDPNGEHGLKPFITNLGEGSVSGFKYLAFHGNEQTIACDLRGKGSLCIRVDDPDHGAKLAEISNINTADKWHTFPTALTNVVGTHALYFVVSEGNLDFASFTIK